MRTTCRDIPTVHDLEYSAYLRLRRFEVSTDLLASEHPGVAEAVVRRSAALTGATTGARRALHADEVLAAQMEAERSEDKALFGVHATQYQALYESVLHGHAFRAHLVAVTLAYVQQAQAALLQAKQLCADPRDSGQLDPIRTQLVLARGAAQHAVGLLPADLVNRLPKLGARVVSVALDGRTLRGYDEALAAIEQWLAALSAP